MSPDKPVHQLWFDDDTYMATRQYYDGSKIEMETSRIQRFTPNGECIETLGGIGNILMVLQTAATLSETALILATQQTFSCIAAARPLLLLHLVDKTSKTVLGSFRFIQTQPSHAMENEFTLINPKLSENRTEACFVEIDDLLKL